VSQRLRSILLQVLVWMVCLTVGLEMQYQLLSSSLREAAQDQAWTELQFAAQRLHDQIEALDLTSRQPGPSEYERIRAIIENNRFPQGMATVVDRDGRPVLNQAGATTERFVLQSSPALTRKYIALSTVPGKTDFLCGTLEQPEGAHLAIACPLTGSAYRLFLHRPMREVEAEAALLRRPFLPISGVTLVWTTALLSIAWYLLAARQSEQLASQRARSTLHGLQRTQELIRTRDAVVFALAKLAGSRDHETGGHLERLSDYSILLAKALGEHPKFVHQISPELVRLIGETSVLHDIGKVGIDDRILRKPGKLTPDERQQMNRHTVIAGNCLQDIEQRLGRSEFLAMAREIALGHHEHWDGTGYPSGLKGEEIPLAARIVAVVDVYDALSTPRIYRPALPHEKCWAIIREGAGRHFDPDIIEVCLKLEDKFREILQCNRHSAASNFNPGLPADESSDNAPPSAAPEPARSTPAGKNPATPSVLRTTRKPSLTP